MILIVMPSSSSTQFGTVPTEAFIFSESFHPCRSLVPIQQVLIPVGDEQPCFSALHKPELVQGALHLQRLP